MPVISFDSALPIEVNHFIFSGCRPTRMNRHDYYELLYVYSGDLVWQIQDRRCRQRAGDLFLIGSALYHRVTESSSPNAKAIALYFLPQFVQSSSEPGDAAQYLMPYLMQDSTFPHVVSADTGVPFRAEELMQKIGAELSAKSELTSMVVATYLKTILLLLCKQFSAYNRKARELQRKRFFLDRIQPVFEFLNGNYARPIASCDLASLLGMSGTAFYRLFKKATGAHFKGYLNRFRIAKAQELLAQTDKPITDVALEVGYCDQSYFGLVFRRLVHLTPHEYRARAEH